MAKPTNCMVPQIRFKGFEGGWHAKTLGNVLRIENGFAFKSKYFCDDKTGVVVLTPGSVKIGGGFQNGKGHFYKSNDDIPIKYKFESGDIFITMTDLTPTAQALGYPAIVPDDGITYLHNQRLGKLVEFDGDKDFLFQLLSTEKYHRIIVSTSSGTTVKHSSPLKVLGVENHFPIIAEQTQIGEYFRELDRLIGLHQRKHDKLVTLKKAMLQKMFPQPGATNPEIRFKGFSRDWEEKRLGELCELFTDGDWIESKDQSASGIRLLQTGNVGVNEFIDKADKARWISLDTFERLKCEEVFAGDILISRLPEPAGRACIVPKLSHRVITAVDCTIVRTAKSCDPAFLVQHCSLDSYFETVNNYLGGGTRQRISRSVLGKFVVKIPKFEEQQKIGTYFRTLDELISKHTTQLQKLQQIKSACLEKMFI